MNLRGVPGGTYGRRKRKIAITKAKRKDGAASLPSEGRSRKRGWHNSVFKTGTREGESFRPKK